MDKILEICKKNKKIIMTIFLIGLFLSISRIGLAPFSQAAFATSAALFLYGGPKAVPGTSDEGNWQKENEPEGISISPQTPLNRPRKPLRFSWIFPAKTDK